MSNKKAPSKTYWVLQNPWEDKFRDITSYPASSDYSDCKKSDAIDWKSGKKLENKIKYDKYYWNKNFTLWK